METDPCLEEPPGDTSNTIVLEGITENGCIFRPSNWPNRLGGLLSTFKRNRLCYSPLLKPAKRNGHSSLLLEPALKEENLQLYNYVLKFARRNNLLVYREKS